MEERNRGFTQEAQKALAESYKEAKKLGHGFVGSEHLVIGILRAGEALSYMALQSHAVEEKGLEERIVTHIGRGDPTMLPQGMTPRCRRIIELAGVEAGNFGKKKIGCEHLLLGILREGENTALGMLREAGIAPNVLAEEVYAMMNFGAEEAGKEAAAGKTGKTHRTPEPIRGELEKCGRDLTAEAFLGRLDPVIGREKEIDQLVRILCRRSKNNPCLVGEPGVGKTAVVEGLAQAISEGAVPEEMQDKVIFSLDIAAVIAGTKYRGEFEERMRLIVRECVKHGNVILFIDEMHNLVGAGGADGAIDAANILKPMLARGELQVIGATTLAEYRKKVEKDAALERRFSKVEVREPEPEAAMEILRGLRPHYEAHHGVRITDEAIKAALELSMRYIHDRFLPDKAIDLIDEAASQARMRSGTDEKELSMWEERLAETVKSKEEAAAREDFEAAALLRDEEMRVRKRKEDGERERPEVTSEEIREIVSERTGIPLTRIGQDEAENLLKLEDELKERVEGQEAAVKAVASAIRRSRVGLGDPQRPVGSFLFPGPSGVGKTALSKALAEILFGSEEALIRVDMTEYTEKHAVSRLIGSPPGYVGHEEGGQLTEKVRAHPFSVVLFDEVEKAHPEVYDLFLQLLDDGRLTDGQGRTVDFRNTVIVMTTNAGGALASGEKSRLGFGGESREREHTELFAELKKTFRPEFLGRIDAVVPFERLKEETLERIAQKTLERTRERASSRGIFLSWSDGLPGWIAKEALKAGGGARPVGRLVRNEVEDRLSEAILAHKLGKDGRAVILLHEGEIRLETETIALPQ